MIVKGEDDSRINVEADEAIVDSIGEAVVVVVSKAAIAQVRPVIASECPEINLVVIATSREDEAEVVMGTVEEIVGGAEAATWTVEEIADKTVAMDVHHPHQRPLAQNLAREAWIDLIGGDTRAKDRAHDLTAELVGPRTIATAGRVDLARNHRIADHQHPSDDGIHLLEVALRVARDAAGILALQDRREATPGRGVTAGTVAHRVRGRAAAAPVDEVSLPIARAVGIRGAQDEPGRTAKDGGRIALHLQHHLHPLVVVNPLTPRKMNDPRLHASLTPNRL